MNDLIKNGDGDLIIEGHYSDMIDHSSVILAIILRAHPEKIYERLKPRGYSKEKITENIQAELLGDSTSFMLEKKKLVEKNRIFEIDTTKKTIEDISCEIHQIIQNPDENIQQIAGKISWLSDESVKIEKYL